MSVFVLHNHSDIVQWVINFKMFHTDFLFNIKQTEINNTSVYSPISVFFIFIIVNVFHIVNNKYAFFKIEGLDTRNLAVRPTELQLAKLSRQFLWEPLQAVLIRLGLEKSKIDEIEFDNRHSRILENIKFLSLLAWQDKQAGTLADLYRAVLEENEDMHSLCQVRHTGSMLYFCRLFQQWLQFNISKTSNQKNNHLQFFFYFI